MNNYPFDLVPPEGQTPIEDNSWLAKRPSSENKRSLEKDASYFIAGAALADAINTAIAVGEPLLLTGEPGTGKTQAAYYTAFQLGVECIHFQVKSDSSARDLLYDFDMVRYFRDAHIQNVDQQNLRHFFFFAFSKANQRARRSIYWLLADSSFFPDSC